MPEDKSAEYTSTEKLKSLKGRHGFVITANFNIDAEIICSFCHNKIEFYILKEKTFIFVLAKGESFESGSFFRQMNAIASGPINFLGLKVRFDILSGFIQTL